MKARGERVGEHLGQFEEGLSSGFLEATKAAVETWIASHKAVGQKPGAGKSKKRKRKPTGDRVEGLAPASPAKSAVAKAATEPEPKEPVKPAKLSYDEDTQILNIAGSHTRE